MARAQNDAQNEPLTMSIDSPLSRIAPADSESQITARPLSLVVRFGRWFPVAVTFNNTGDAVQGTVTLQLTSSAGANEMGPVTTFETTVDLPANARKRVWLYARLERGECDGGRVSFNGNGFKAMRRDFTLLAPDEGARLLLTISDSDQRLNFLSGFNALRTKNIAPLPNFGNGFGRRRRNFSPPNSAVPPSAPLSVNNGRAVETLGAGHEWIPTRWIGLESLDAVVLHDFPHTSLTPEQLDALRDYVASGGTLIVFGGANWQRLAQSPLQSLWPLTPQSADEATSAETAQLVRATVKKAALNAADRLGGAPLIVTRGALRADASTSNGGLTAARNEGAGRVVWLSFDPTRPPFLDWSGQENLWRAVFAQTARPARLSGVDERLETPGYSIDGGSFYGNENDAVKSATNLLRRELASSPQMRTPPAAAIAWFLALYVFILVPVNYVVLRAIDRRELAWVTVPVIVLLFSVLSYLAAVRIKGTQVRLRQVNIVQGSGDSSRARADAMLWLFSPRKTTYSITGQNEQGKTLPSMASAIYADAARSDALEYARSQQPDAGAPLQVRNAPVNMWDFKTFIGHAVVDSGRGVAAKRDDNGATFTNRTGVDWRGAIWIENGKAYRVGDLANGKTTAMKRSAPATFDNAQLIEMSKVGDIFRFGQNTGQNIANVTLNAALTQQNHGGDPLLLAWSVAPVAALQAQDTDEAGQNVTLWVWRLPQLR